MAAGSNTGFHCDDMSSALNWHWVSFQSGAVSSLPEMVPMGNYFGLNSNTSGMMMYSGNSSIINNVYEPVTSLPSNAFGSSLLLDSVPGLRHEERLAAEWSVDEQCKLEEGLAKYDDEPSFMKYIKIASTLHDKTVRDVALRCTFMTRKRRKPEEPMVKMVNNRKDKLVKSSSKQYCQSTPTPSMTTYSLISNHMNKSQGIPWQDGKYIISSHHRECNTSLFDFEVPIQFGQGRTKSINY
uniref:Myb-like domain-containing protein n=1 Tax=Glycine max TaxID=3847 RepID=A0A0R0IK46_SOYBN